MGLAQLDAAAVPTARLLPAPAPSGRLALPVVTRRARLQGAAGWEATSWSMALMSVSIGVVNGSVLRAARLRSRAPSSAEMTKSARAAARSGARPSGSKRLTSAARHRVNTPWNSVLNSSSPGPARGPWWRWRSRSGSPNVQSDRRRSGPARGRAPRGHQRGGRPGRPSPRPRRRPGRWLRGRVRPCRRGSGSRSIRGVRRCRGPRRRRWWRGSRAGGTARRRRGSSGSGCRCVGA